MDKNGSKWSEEDDNYLFDNILLQNEFLSEKLKRTSYAIISRKEYIVAKQFVNLEKDFKIDELCEDDLKICNFCKKFEVHSYYVYEKVKQNYFLIKDSINNGQSGSKWSIEDDKYLFDNILLQNNFLSGKLNRTSQAIMCRKENLVAKEFINLEKDITSEELCEDDLELYNICKKFNVYPYYVYTKVKKILSINTKPKDIKPKYINFDEIKEAINKIDSYNPNIELLKNIRINLTKFINKNK